MPARRLLAVSLALVFALPAGVTGAGLRVMVTNDDGIDAPGLAALVSELAKEELLDVTVVAPATHQSAMSHAIATRGPVRVEKRPSIFGCPAWAVFSTPATTSRVGLSWLMADAPPQLVISGINRGENEGVLCWYSGTVAAAREAAMAHVPAVAFSLELDWGDPKPDWEAAARLAHKFLSALLENGLPHGYYLSVNIPRDASHAKGFVVTTMSQARAAHEGFRKVGGEGESVVFLEPVWEPATDSDPATDTSALDEGWVTVTPLGLDATYWRALPELRWVLDIQ